jgi:hypothetical protein
VIGENQRGAILTFLERKTRFLPAIYDYKTRLAGIPPHLFGIKSEEIVFAMDQELKESCSEILISGYNI